ncbi:protoporphyrinogen oxidase HemJ [Sulfurimonas sp. MAG313]|nr:protoporphyrinogen oxidase HemJ [Sulfurimonas sp. MAG313]MDF1882201.1 protoporphyrinogen oxidase HemJ [Sulfurimonas sp. MAG313]
MQYYDWIKWFHLISLISWFAVLFYMPRLFVYHVENLDKKDFVDVVKVMEKKIYKFIGIPAFWATLMSGLVMIALNPGLFQSGGWLHAKLALVFILILFFFSMGHYRKQFLEDRCEKSSSFFRKYNEIPTILMFIIVAMVIVKPF